jgi:hypothetical protein
MLNASSSNFHVEYMDVTQHWSPESERYAGGDCLMTALHNGWEMSPTVRVEQKWYAGMRHVTIYHVELRREGKTMVMPIINNPYVTRQFSQMDEVEVVPMDGGS